MFVAARSAQWNPITTGFKGVDVNLKPKIAFVTAVLLALPASSSAEKLPSIFDGKDLNAWKVPKDNIWWKVKDDVLQVRSGPAKSGQTLWTKKAFKNFVMEFDFRFVAGTVDTGIFMRNAHDQIQIGISGSLKRDMTGSPYIPGKGYPVEAKGVKELLKLKDWNSMTIVAIGKNYSVWLNGKKVMSYESESAIEEGPVGIQLHGSRDMACDYRNIRIASLR